MLLKNHSDGRDFLSLAVPAQPPVSRLSRDCFFFCSRFAAGCYASFCLPSPSLGTEQKEARTQGLISIFLSITPN